MSDIAISKGTEAALKAHATRKANAALADLHTALVEQLAALYKPLGASVASAVSDAAHKAAFGAVPSQTVAYRDLIVSPVEPGTMVRCILSGSNGTISTESFGGRAKSVGKCNAASGWAHFLTSDGMCMGRVLLDQQA